MSPYEILAVAALAAAGIFAYRLYRSDTRPGAPQQPPNAGQPMFGRTQTSGDRYSLILRSERSERLEGWQQARCG